MIFRSKTFAFYRFIDKDHLLLIHRSCFDVVSFFSIMDGELQTSALSAAFSELQKEYFIEARSVLLTTMRNYRDRRG